MKAAALLMILLSGAAGAASSPETICTEYFAALKKDGMTAAASYIHPDELARFKQMLMPLFRRAAAKQDHRLAEGFFGPGTRLEQLEAMSAADFMTGVLRAVGEKMDVNFGDVEVLGTVREKEVVHVVARVTAEAGDETSKVKVKTMEVVSTRPFGDGWKLLLSGELEGLASALGGQ
jgi:hypothetical protein